jgi:hypothetical protein
MFVDSGEVEYDWLVPVSDEAHSMQKAIIFPLLLAAASVSYADEPESLGWLQGHWCGGNEERRIEEIWLQPSGGELLGLGRTTTQHRTLNFEFLRIAVIDGHTTYLAQPGGREPTPFRLTATGIGSARFENPDHDFPTGIEYKREGDRLDAVISGPAPDGTTRRISFAYRLCE